MTRLPTISTSRNRAFTLVELLVSLTVMVLLAVILVGILDSASRITQQTRNSIESFQAARAAFETITSRLAQATLNTYYSYDDLANPTLYRRQSELHFLTGQAKDILPSDVLQNQRFGHAIFFQYPGGFNPDLTGPLRELLNGCGYFISFCKEDDERLGLVPEIPGLNISEDKYRYRLIEVLQPAANLGVYKDPTAHQWIVELCKMKETQFGVLADNVFLLAILPRLSPSDDVMRTSLAPEYTYDSRADRAFSSTTATGDKITSSTLHQLPPQVEVVMIALDRPSAQRLAAKNGDSPPDLGVGEEASRFVEASKLDEDLAELLKLLNGNHLRYRVFRTVVPIKGAKWSPERKKP